MTEEAKPVPAQDATEVDRQKAQQIISIWLPVDDVAREPLITSVAAALTTARTEGQVQGLEMAAEVAWKHAGKNRTIGDTKKVAEDIRALSRPQLPPKG